ncbi:MAG: TonB-dependent receptor [Proteobacteria bacterium]|nr:TonB-dependent receptor [Pseudomonadota bacterium]
MTDATRHAFGSGKIASETSTLTDIKNGVYVMQPIAAAVIATLNPGAAVAQDNDGLRIEEIVVTATKREMNMQDLGQSIAAITTGDIEKQGIQNLEDVMRVLPSVSLASSTPGRNSIVFRGIATGTQEYYSDSQVAVYLDEQPITTISQQPEMRMVDINRIESLPGPQGTLFGSSSQAGTLRYITNKPDPNGFSAQVGTEVSSTKGGEGSWDVNGWVNVPLASDRLAVRVAAYASHDGGYVDNVLGSTLEGSQDNAAVVEEDYNEWDNEGARVRALWIINDGWDLNLSYMLQNSSIEGAWETDPAIGDFKHTKFHKEFRDDDWTQASATVKGDLGFAELTVNASFFDRDIVYEWDNMVYEQWKDAYWGPYYNGLYDSDYTFGWIFNDQQEKSDAYEIRLSSKGDSKLNWMIGGYYEDKSTYWDYGAKNPDLVGTTSWYTAQAFAYYYANYLGYDVAYPLPPTDIGYRQLYVNTIEQTAVFAEMNFDVTDELRLTVGGRWFEYERLTDKTDYFPVDLFPPLGSADVGGRTVSSGKESDTVLKLGASYNVADDVMLFAHYAEGFRLGGDNSPRAAKTGLVPATYLSDKVENIELGVKSTFNDGRVMLNVLAFSMEWDDIQISQSSVNSLWWLRGTLNGGKGENKGFEVETRWQATSALYIYGQASFGDPKYTEEIVRLNDVVPAGTPMVWAYKEKFSFGLDYTVPDIFGGELWFGYNQSYEGEKWNTLGNAIDRDPDGLVPSSTMANAHVGLTLESGLEFQLTVRNVWDELAVNGLYNDSSGQFFGDPRFDNQTTYARPRTIGLAIRKKFE